MSPLDMRPACEVRYDQIALQVEATVQEPFPSGSVIPMVNLATI